LYRETSDVRPRRNVMDPLCGSFTLNSQARNYIRYPVLRQREDGSIQLSWLRYRKMEKKEERVASARQD
jgi:hypothetical protein